MIQTTSGSATGTKATRVAKIILRALTSRYYQRVNEPAGDFEADTTVEGSDGFYRAVLSDNWALWGPAGGYVSAIALRAAGKRSRFRRPASYSCNYLGVADFAPIDITAEPISSAKRSEVVRVRLAQKDKVFLDATVWTIDEGLHGIEHDADPMPDVPGPDGLIAWRDVTPPPEAFQRFWSHIEERPINMWTRNWLERDPGPPIREGWCRFRPKATFVDPFTDAARSLLLIDTLGWPAAMEAHTGEPPFMAPTIELSARFHRLIPKSEWLLARVTAPIATEGLIGSDAKVWSQDGRLVASGGQHMLSRPIPNR